VSAALHVLAAGPGVTLQDGGRHGYLRFGVTIAGPMDPLAFATANLAAGVAADAPAIEVSLGGVELAAEGQALVLGIAGGAFRIALGEQVLPAASLLRLEPGERLQVRAGEAGAWCYVAVAGRIDIPPVLGSVATHTRSGLGGVGGRGLVASDLLPIAEPRLGRIGVAAILARWLNRPGERIRVVLGPQDDYFTDEAIATFLAGPWRLSARSDRMAYLVDGPRLDHARGYNIVSDGIAHGAIQVPGDGRPIILMADRQPTGGYPKIATVISADLGQLAQMRPGAQLTFAAISIAEAVAARRRERDALAAGVGFKPLVRTHFPSEFLLERNLIDGVTAGE
jgi:biotin-dependent carboxylase-like uncharacterized protein